MTIPQGAMRFNTDSMKLEYYRGGPVGFGTTTQTGEWVNITTDSPDIQTGGARGVFGGGYTAPATSFNVIQYITISSTGNAIDFGDLSAAKGLIGACSSSTRGVFSGGTVVSDPYPKTNVMLMGQPRHDDFNVAGYGVSAKVGLNLTFFKYFFIQAELKGGYINMPNIKTTFDNADSASQHFMFFQRIIAFGGIFKI